MNFGKGGQNIVQSGNNNPNVFRGVGGILGKFLDTRMRVAERDYHRGKDLDAKKEFEDYKNSSKLIHETAGNLIAPHVMGNVFDFANQTHGEDHPDVISGKRKSTDYLRPELREQIVNNGIISTRSGILPGTPSKAEKAAKAWENSRSNQVDENTKFAPIPSTDNPDAGTVARFGKDGTVNRKEITTTDILGKKNKTQRAPMGMRADDSTAPTDRTWTPEEKSALESERPRTNGLNDGINDGKGGSN
jgi:hypothetical protein